MEPSTETPQPTAGQTADPSVMVIFGASGDLTKRKLIPALYNLEREKLLSKEFAVVGISRRDMSHDAFREKPHRRHQELRDPYGRVESMG